MPPRRRSTRSASITSGARPRRDHPGDLIYIQGHSSPGIYARAYLEGRLSEEQLRHFRQEVAGNGLSSYPHPWLMPDFWQFPTVSMGLGPMMAIYQARFIRYLEHRGLAAPSDRKVWCFCGDGEMDEPESMGALTMPVRESLDNLIFVINCNLQRLDGPVRGNGKIIQELEAAFLGAGWNVIKVLWGARWDPLLARDTAGILRRVMEQCVDGEYQNFKAKGGAYTREHFFGKDPALKEMVANMSDEDIWHLNRGGHDARKVYAAYDAAVRTQGKPTVILAKTVKGFGLGKSAEGQMVAHQQKKLDVDALRALRDRFNIPVPDEDLERLPFRKPPEDSAEMRYLHERRRALGGYLPARKPSAAALTVPAAGGVPFHSRWHRRARDLHDHGVRAHPDGAAEGSRHRQAHRADRAGRGAHLRHGGTVPPDRHLLLGRPALYAGRCRDADVLPRGQEGADDRGGHHRGGLGVLVDRGGDLLCQSRHRHGAVLYLLLDVRFSARRRLPLGGRATCRRAAFCSAAPPGAPRSRARACSTRMVTASCVATTIPNCRAYDPTYAYELAVIIQDGLRRMYAQNENIFYYISLMNENYAQPALPAGVESGILQRRLSRARCGQAAGAGKKDVERVTLLGSGTILRECLAAAELLEQQFGVAAEVFSITSFSELRREALACDHWNLLHPAAERARALRARAARRAAQVRWSPRPTTCATSPSRSARGCRSAMSTLGTDGFGRSDARAPLRAHFEVDRAFHQRSRHSRRWPIRAASSRSRVAGAIATLGIDRREGRSDHQLSGTNLRHRKDRRGLQRHSGARPGQLSMTSPSSMCW